MGCKSGRNKTAHIGEFFLPRKYWNQRKYTERCGYRGCRNAPYCNQIEIDKDVIIFIEQSKNEIDDRNLMGGP